MTDSTGSSPRSSSFGATERRFGSIGVGFAICIALGVAIVLSDVYLRVPLHLPGWRGFIGMGLLVLARRLTGQPWGASLAALAAALASFSLAKDMRFGPLAYLLPGLVIDLVCLIRPATWNATLAAGLAAGLGNLAKLVVTLLSVTLVAHKGVGFGIPIAALSHVLFGFCGGALAAWPGPRTPRPETIEDRR